MIERANGILTMKFQKLLYLDVTNLSFIPNIVTAACVLHNFIRDAEGPIDEEAVEDELIQFRQHHDLNGEEDEWDDSGDEEEPRFVEAAIYRRRIANYVAGHKDLICGPLTLLP